MPTVLICASPRDLPLTTYETAAARAGVTLHVVTDAPGAHGPHDTVLFEPDDRHLRAVLDGLAGTPVDGIVAASDAAAWLAASLAQALELPLHTPDAVRVAGDALLTRGRLLATGLPVPWFVAVPAHGDDDLDRLAYVRFPCQIRAAHLSTASAALRVDSYEALMAARLRLANWLTRPDVRRQLGGDDTLIVEGRPSGQGLVLAGTLELGTLRVLALFEAVAAEGDDDGDQLHVTPARLAPSRQQVIAGHVARAALALGLHHGPITAACRVDEDAIVVEEVVPAPPPALLGRAIPVISPERERCGIEDVLLAHALGRPLDHYGHQAIASGVLRRHAASSGVLLAVEGLDVVRQSDWVTEAVLQAEVGALVAPPPEGHPVAAVIAQGAQPDDVVTTLRDAAARLHLRVG